MIAPPAETGYAASQQEFPLGLEPVASSSKARSEDVRTGRWIWPILGSMGFRDDHEALRARAEAAEALAADTDARLDAMEQRVEEVESEIGALREELREDRRAATPPRFRASADLRRSIRRWAPLVAGVIIAGAAALAVFVRTPPTASYRDKEARTREEPPPRPASPVPPEQPSTPEVPPEPRLATEQPAIPPPTDTRWDAEITATAGADDLEVGRSCSILANAADLRFSSINDDVALSIVCGERTLYDWQEPAVGDTSRGCTLWEQAEGERFVHWARCHDRGVRQGRAELTLDTLEGSARIFRSDGSLDVRLHVEHVSAPRNGRGLYRSRPAPPPIVETLERTAIVQEVTGVGGRLGDRCTLRISPPDAGHHPSRANCRAVLRCRSTLYGAGTSGWNLCAVDAERRPLHAHDTKGTAEDGDPTFSFDLTTGEVRVGDVDGERSTLMVLAIQPEPPP